MTIKIKAHFRAANAGPFAKAHPLYQGRGRASLAPSLPDMELT